MHPCHRIANPPHTKIRQRQPDKVLKQTCSKFYVNPGGGVRKSIGSQSPEHGFKNPDTNQRNHQNIKARQPAVDQHLVNYHLKQQRRHQRKQLQKERGQNNLAEQPAIFHDRRNKPRNVKLAVFAVDKLTAGHH